MKQLTGINEANTIQSAEETDAGNAEVQPARDSRTRATNVAGVAGLNLPSRVSRDHSKPFYSLRKPESPHAAEKYSAKAFVHFTLNQYTAEGRLVESMYEEISTQQKGGKP